MTRFQNDELAESNAISKSSSPSAFDVLVVGGGIAGLAATIAAQQAGLSVALIESGVEVGGLLRSRDLGEMGRFDWGTHVIHETGIRRVDEVMYDHLTKQTGWNTFTCCPSATFFNGQLTNHGFIHASNLGSHLHDEGLRQMLALTPTYGPFDHLEDQLLRTFGEIFSNHVFAPALEKFFGVPASDLAPEMHTLIGLKRIVCGTADAANRLKSLSKWNDERFAFHDVGLGARPVRHLYPNAGGIGKWVDGLCERIVGCGGEINTGRTIVSVNQVADGAFKITLDDARVIDANRIAWTVAPMGLIRVMEGNSRVCDSMDSENEGRSSNSSGFSSRALNRSSTPAFCQTDLVDLVVRGRLQSEQFYVTNYDPSFRSFRVTLYDNMHRHPPSSLTRVTVEVMSPSRMQEATSCDEILDELKRMGIVDERSKLETHNVERIEKSFPIPTIGFMESQRLSYETADAVSDRIDLLGRASGKQFFTNDVILDCFSRFTECGPTEPANHAERVSSGGVVS